jgi:hypothetical protein
MEPLAARSPNPKSNARAGGTAATKCPSKPVPGQDDMNLGVHAPHYEKLQKMLFQSFRKN